MVGGYCTLLQYLLSVHIEVITLFTTSFYYLYFLNSMLSIVHVELLQCKSIIMLFVCDLIFPRDVVSFYIFGSNNQSEKILEHDLAFLFCKILLFNPVYKTVSQAVKASKISVPFCIPEKLSFYVVNL